MAANSPSNEKIEVENVNHPGQITRVNAAKYLALRDLVLDALPTKAPGLTAAELKEAVRPNAPQDLFPQGKTLSWWLKSVQLDLEAKGLVARTATTPLTFFKP